MSEIAIFEEVLNNFIQKYNVVVERPYGENSSYLVFRLKGGYILGEMNYGGYNLLQNLTELTIIFRGMLI